ncbi:MAG: hypothetical protein ACYDGM_01165 [Vulcanimicrobiaceae bacterium]
MTNVRTMAAALALALAVVACSAPPTPQQQRHAQERARLARLQQSYGTTIMGFDIHGTTVNVGVDLNQIYSMSEDDQNALEAAALRTWRAAWLQAHPHRHALLTTRFIDFHGNLQSARSVKV